MPYAKTGTLFMVVMCFFVVLTELVILLAVFL